MLLVVSGNDKELDHFVNGGIIFEDGVSEILYRDCRLRQAL
jgi:hypothetical protein